MQPDPFITTASPMQQYQPHEGSDRVSEYQSHSQHPTPPTSSSGIIPPSSKAGQLSIPIRPRGDDSLHSRPISDSLEPPGYDE